MAVKGKLIMGRLCGTNQYKQIPLFPSAYPQPPPYQSRALHRESAQRVSRHTKTERIQTNNSQDKHSTQRIHSVSICVKRKRTTLASLGPRVMHSRALKYFSHQVANATLNDSRYPIKRVTTVLLYEYVVEIGKTNQTL